MFKNKNIVEVSELQKFQTNIENLTGEAEASRGLIASSIEDLKTVNAEMATQSTAITELISNLEEKRTALEAAMYQNTALIEKLQAAFTE